MLKCWGAADGCPGNSDVQPWFRVGSEALLQGGHHLLGEGAASAGEQPSCITLGPAATTLTVRVASALS